MAAEDSSIGFLYETLRVACFPKGTAQAQGKTYGGKLRSFCGKFDSLRDALRVRSSLLFLSQLP
ncbi:MAG: hypothetical protein ACYTXY_39125, partial [Nostoc sp.]